MSEWLAMGGHGWFVWSSYGLGTLTVAWNLWAAAQQTRRVREQIKESMEDASAS